MITFSRLIHSLSIMVLLCSAAYADKFGQIKTALSPHPQQFQRTAPIMPPVHRQPHIQRAPQVNVSPMHNRSISPNRVQVLPQTHNIPHQHGQGHPMNRDGFHVEFNNHHGRGHFGRFHQYYYPWGVYPYTYYYQSAPTVEDSIPDNSDSATAVDQGDQAQSTDEIQPKIIKILPDGTVVDKSPTSSDKEDNRYDDDSP